MAGSRSSCPADRDALLTSLFGNCIRTWRTRAARHLSLITFQFPFRGHRVMYTRPCSGSRSPSGSVCGPQYLNVTVRVWFLRGSSLRYQAGVSVHYFLVLHLILSTLGSRSDHTSYLLYFDYAVVRFGRFQAIQRGIANTCISSWTRVMP